MQKEIILIDGYVDVDTLNILAKKNAGADVKIYTYASAQLTNRDAANFNAQYPTLTVKKTQVFHDRFIILDYEEPDERIYHCGASSKDAAVRLTTAITELTSADIKPHLHMLIDQMKNNPALILR